MCFFPHWKRYTFPANLPPLPSVPPSCDTATSLPQQHLQVDRALSFLSARVTNDKEGCCLPLPGCFSVDPLPNCILKLFLHLTLPSRGWSCGALSAPSTSHPVETLERGAQGAFCTDAQASALQLGRKRNPPRPHRPSQTHAILPYKITNAPEFYYISWGMRLTPAVFLKYSVILPKKGGGENSH